MLECGPVSYECNTQWLSAGGISHMSIRGYQWVDEQIGCSARWGLLGGYRKYVPCYRLFLRRDSQRP